MQPLTWVAVAQLPTKKDCLQFMRCSFYFLDQEVFFGVVAAILIPECW
jgi:hypothetical protein